MGNTQTNQAKVTDVIDIQLSHPKFNNSKLVKTITQVNIQTTIACEQKQFNLWQKSLQGQKNSTITANQHLFLPTKQSFQSTKLCGSSGHAVLTFPYYPYLLSEEIYNRLGRKTRFQQTDLWYLLYSLVSAREEVVKLGAKGLGDVRTGNVFLNDEGRVKVGCAVSWPGEQDVWEKAIQKQPVYLAPQLFQRLVRGESQSQYTTKQQLFSIGLTMLNSALLIDDTSTSPIINFKQMQFNHSQLQRRINDWIVVRGFSDILKAIVMNLVEIKEGERVTHEELWRMLQPHVEEIRGRRNFVIANAPGRIHAQVVRYREVKARLTQKQQQFSSKNNIVDINYSKPLLQTSTVVKHQIAANILPSSTKEEQYLGKSLQNLRVSNGYGQLQVVRETGRETGREKEEGNENENENEKIKNEIDVGEDKQEVN